MPLNMNRLFCLLAVIFLMYSGGFLAQPSIAQEIPGKVLVFATPENEGVFTLYQREVFDEVSKRTGIKCILKELPKKRCLVDTNKGFYAGVAARIQGLETEYLNLKRVRVSHFTVQHIVFSKNDDAAEAVHDIKSLVKHAMEKDYIVGYLRGSKKAQRLLSSLPEKKTYPVDHPDSGFTAVKRGLIGAYLAGPAIVNRAIFKVKFKQSGIKEICVLSETKLFPYVHIEHADFIPKFENTLQSMADDGTLSRIRQLLE